MKISPLSVVISSVLIFSAVINMYTLNKYMSETVNSEFESSMSQIENVEMQSFNSQFANYGGDNVKVINAFLLISQIIENNETNIDYPEKMVGVTTSGLTSNVDFTTITYKDSDLEMIRNYIDKNAYYSIEFEYTDGFITSVNITKK